MKYTLTVPPQPGAEDDDISTNKSIIFDSPRRSSEKDFSYWHNNSTSEDDRYESEKKPFCRPSCIPITLILVLIVLVVLLPLLDGHERNNGAKHRLFARVEDCDKCSIQLVESIPEGLTYPNSSVRFMSTFEAWDMLIRVANETIQLGSFYWTLRASDLKINHSSAWEGEHIYDSLLKAGTKNKLNVRIAQSKPTDVSTDEDTAEYEKAGAASVRSLDFDRLMGGGVLHTKLWVVDQKHFYVGSANMDWRSLTQVKELGVLVLNCPCLAQDLSKIFEVYWKLGEAESRVPPKWPAELSTSINESSPIEIPFVNAGTSQVYISSSPRPFNPTGRTNDLDAIVNTILDADKFVYISVMDYVPLVLYSKPKLFWATIDSAIRKVALEKKVHVRLLISHWQHSRPEIQNFLLSLIDLTNAFPGVTVEARRFVVPTSADQEKIPFARVNHNKYMVTDKVAYIGTSNWSGDYFINTAGVGVVVRDSGANPQSIRAQLQSIFERDWFSPYAIKA